VRKLVKKSKFLFFAIFYVKKEENRDFLRKITHKLTAVGIKKGTKCHFCTLFSTKNITSPLNFNRQTHKTTKIVSIFTNNIKNLRKKVQKLKFLT
jgi:hypothetical protein